MEWIPLAGLAWLPPIPQLAVMAWDVKGAGALSEEEGRALGLRAMESRELRVQRMESGEAEWQFLPVKGRH